MEKHKKFILNLIFNMAETAIILLVGVYLKISINYLLMILLTFMISRQCFGKPLHYKTWYRCLVWSTLLMLCLFVLFKVDWILSILFAIFNALIMTGRSDIKDMYLWNNSGDPGKYQDVAEYVKFNEFNDRLIEFEKKLKEKDNLEYLIYKYRFKEGNTFDEIKEKLNNTIGNARLVEHLDKISFALRLYCGI